MKSIKEAQLEVYAQKYIDTFQQTVGLCPEIKAEIWKPCIEDLSLSMMTIIWGADSDNITLEYPDGPWNRFKTRHPWARRLFGKVKMGQHTLKATWAFPELVMPHHCGTHQTLDVCGEGFSARIPVAAMTYEELVTAEYDILTKTHISQEDLDYIFERLNLKSKLHLAKERRCG